MHELPLRCLHCLKLPFFGVFSCSSECKAKHLCPNELLSSYWDKNLKGISEAMRLLEGKDINSSMNQNYLKPNTPEDENKVPIWRLEKLSTPCSFLCFL